MILWVERIAVAAELQAQTCSMDGDDPFTSICTPAKGVSNSVKVALSSLPPWILIAAAPLQVHGPTLHFQRGPQHFTNICGLQS